ncbi:XkdF-like putative serine protease domain-containing protein [Aeromonas caviae]|uniref:XkdF-like putative serine protease domain-containing protein n=1 Tax=Aeromonas caviae TaxID=648 RepID=A0AA42VC57_AERCA|nr:XkdF-like putative serine protease domain-containing protein [Aeromonas caviae]MDH1898002.1 XkdF-like putative serine protease domain-containing protein [Aeromonas caviae]
MIKNFKELILKSAKQETEERISVEVMYVPEEFDAHNQFMTAETIRKACEDFNSNLAAGNISANLYHLSNTNKFEILKSWINEIDMVSTTGQEVKEGTWLVKLRYSPELWEMKKAGKLQGVSIGCRGVVNPETGEISQVSFSPD